MKEDMLVQDTNVVDEQEEGTTSQQPTIESLTAERDQLVDQLQRSVAEFRNYRRRTDEQRSELRAHATRDVMLSMVPLIDDLIRAFANIPEDNATGRTARGIWAIERKFLNILERNGVTRSARLASHSILRFTKRSPRMRVAIARTSWRSTRQDIDREISSLRPAMVKVGAEPGFQRIETNGH